MTRKANMLESLVRVISVTGLVCSGAISSGIAVAEEILSDELMQCSLVEELSERLDCFENFIGRHVRAATSEMAIQMAPDNLGAETLPLEAREDIEKLAVRAVVTSCRKDSLGKNLFIFDNGHVWKQKDDKRLRFTECNFDVTITKDVFGYKMQRVGETSQIRIARVK